MGLLSGFLLDTHTLLWWYTVPESLPRNVFDMLSASGERGYVSSVSAYEIALKHRTGKLPGVDDLVMQFAYVLAESGFTQLPVSCEHAIAAGSLDLRHRDPFDRLLIAQALGEDLTMLSIDKRFDLYGVRRLW